MPGVRTWKEFAEHDERYKIMSSEFQEEKFAGMVSREDPSWDGAS